MKLPFYKLDGAGNDFVGFDWRSHVPVEQSDLSNLVKQVCDRYHGVGADGVLIILPSSKQSADFKMKYLNSDGTVGEMCGNGARCIARFADTIKAASQNMAFETDAGDYQASVEGNSDLVSVSFPDVEELPQRVSLSRPAEGIKEVDFFTVGVPHAVIFCDELEKVDVMKAGRAIRQDPVFEKGTNANFIHDDGKVLHVRTYERGVETETQACGTGAVASTICLMRKLGKSSLIQKVLPTGQIPLEISVSEKKEGFEKIYLKGPARVSFTGDYLY